MKKWVKELLPYLVILAVVVLVKTFIVSPILVHGESMVDTLHDKDVMILNKIGMKLDGLKRFDIVVINTESTKLIKRIIGLPGETIEYKEQKLYINGKELDDPYENGSTPNVKSIKLKDNEYFVLGDNRGNSLDSSELGPFKKKQIMGKTNFTIFPFSRFGTK